MHDLFISYSHKDKDFVRRLVSDLKDIGINVWIDDSELKLGDSVLEKIISALDRVKYVIAISKNSINSTLVKKELEVAMNQEIDGKRVKVIPLLIYDVELPSFLTGKMYGDFRNDNSYSDEFFKLLRAIGVEESIIQQQDTSGIGELYNRIGMQILIIDASDEKQKSIEIALKNAEKHVEEKNMH